MNIENTEKLQKTANPSTKLQIDSTCANKEVNETAKVTEIANISEEKNFKHFNANNKMFHKKVEAIDYLKNYENLYLISEDKSMEKGNKRFYALDYETLYNYSISKKTHLYENFELCERLKLFLDIDIKKEKIPATADKDELFKNIIKKSINLILDQLLDYEIGNPQIIIISSNRPEKLSAHIIFNDVVFTDIVSMKFFMMKINSEMIKDKTIDMNVYKVGCCRLLWNSKYGKSTPLDYHKSINYTRQSDRELFMNCLLKYLPESYKTINCPVPQNLPIKEAKVQNIKSKKGSKKSQKFINKALTEIFSIEEVKKYVDTLSQERCDDYIDWLHVGMAIFNCCPTIEGFNLWDQWSQKSDSYCGRDLCIYKWNSFRTDGGLTIASLKFYAKRDNPELYDNLDIVLDKQLYESIKYELDYILDEKEKIKLRSSLAGKTIDDWFRPTNRSKVLSIRSTYNTGKTKLIAKIITEYQPKRILFVSYRQSLTQDLYNVFKDHNVDSYLDGKFYGGRIICQIESLWKLIPDYVFDGAEVPSYDIVILDEIESILSHFNSSTIKEKEKTFNLLKAIIYNSKRVLALDGDFGNRAYEFVKDINNDIEPIILENTIKKNKRHFIFMQERALFDQKIETDLKNGLNVAVISMSATVAEKYYATYKDTYKSAIYVAETSDEEKRALKNVDKSWTGLRFLTYSPTVESGVSYNLKNFHKIYIVLCSKSTCPRALLQMTCRIRQVEDSNICVLLNGMPFKERANFYTFEETKEYVLHTIKRYLPNEIVLDKETDKMVIQYKYDIFSKILIYNEMENLNKNPYYFVAYLIKLLKEKGHTYEYVKGKNTKEINKGAVLKEELFKAEDIDGMKYGALMTKIKSNNASRDEKIMIKKYMFKEHWKIPELTLEFIDKYYNETHKLFNLRYLLNPQKINAYLSVDYGDTQTINFEKVKILEQISIINEVITKLGFENVSDQKALEKEQFEEGIKKVLKECKLFTEPNNSLPLFGLNKIKTNDIKVKCFLGFINTIFKNWGFNLTATDKKYIQVKINNKWKTKSQFKYSINYLNGIINYV